MPTHQQTAKIFAAAREIGLDSDGVYDLVESACGARSVRALSVQQAAIVIDNLVRAGASSGAGKPKQRKPSGRRLPAGVMKMITPAQRAAIEHRRGELGGDWLRDDYFAGVCGKVIGKPAAITAADAAKVIEAMKKRRAYDRQAGRA